MCSSVRHTLAQGSENTDFILQNDTSKHSNSQKGTLLFVDSVSPTALNILSALNIHATLPFMSVVLDVGEGEEDSLSHPLGTVLLTFNLSRLLISSGQICKARPRGLEACLFLHCFRLHRAPTSFITWDVLTVLDGYSRVVSHLSTGARGGSRGSPRTSHLVWHHSVFNRYWLKH